MNKLSDEQVKRIKELVLDGRLSRREIAEYYKVAYVTVMYHTNERFRARVISNSAKYQKARGDAKRAEKERIKKELLEGGVNGKIS